MPEIFETITALHQQIREYIEKDEPEYKVTSIDGFTTTQYARTLDTQWEIHPDFVEMAHTFTDMRFRVSAEYVADAHRTLFIDVRVTSDGQLHRGDRLMSR